MRECKLVFVYTCAIVLKLEMENIPQYSKTKNQKESSALSYKSLQLHKLLLREFALLSISLDVIKTANSSNQS